MATLGIANPRLRLAAWLGGCGTLAAITAVAVWAGLLLFVVFIIAVGTVRRG